MGGDAAFSQDWAAHLRLGYRLGETPFGWSYGVAMGIGLAKQRAAGTSGSQLTPGVFATIPLGGLESPFKARLGLASDITFNQAGGGAYAVFIPWHVAWQTASNREWIFGTDGLGLRWLF